ncbi:NACHT domain-containing protein [Agarivorans litoreus]|uniref:NACHT domain-containing protein n=1 Tax=Agarivorans litoreus TaxID=1510455 RepID=UPI001C7D921C|nr:NACHT domain-containing protein [Agarivorans litoreus]
MTKKSITFNDHGYRDVLRKGVTIIDGKRLLSLIDKHKPELIREISGDSAYIGEKIKPALSNKALMDALHLGDTKELCDIYCETKLELGNDRERNNKELVKYDYTTTKTTISSETVDKATAMEKSFTLLTGVELYEKDSLSLFRASLTKKERLKKQISILSDEIINIANKVREKISKSSFAKVYPNVASSDFDDFIKSEYRHVNLGPDEFSDFSSEVFEIKSMMEGRGKKRDEVEKLRGQDSLIETSVTINYNSSILCQLLNESIDKLVHYENTTITDIKDYLLISQKIECFYKIIESMNLDFKQSSEVIPRTSSKVSITEVFQSSLNVIVLGDAGSGKTTNLQVYTKSLLESSKKNLVIYLTLNDLAFYALKSDERCLTKGIWYYLAELSVNNFSFFTLKEHLKNKKVCLVLDSIDEAVVQHDWIVSSLNEFSVLYSNCQIITSSRFTVSDLHTLGFVSISLLPFDRGQKEEFFEKWFSERPELVKEILCHLDSRPKLDRVITNPLSATIMASLQDSAVPLPNTEASLYKKRFELLSGLFDKFKGVNRMTSSPEVILKCSRELAYHMHDRKCRELCKEDIIVFLTKNLHDERIANEVYAELITPCEILLVNPNGKYGFGHLRFQEYLASEQLVNLRKIRLDKMLVSSWWHDVFLLYAQHAYEIEWLVDYATNNEMTRKTHKLLLNITSHRPPAEEKKLNQRIEIAFKQELDGLLY